MGEKSNTQAQIEKLIELANNLEKRELALNRETEHLEALRAALDERERTLSAAAAKAVNDAAAAPKPALETVKPPLASPQAEAPVKAPAEKAKTPEPEKAADSAKAVSEINEVLQSIFWDYANSVHTISSQLSTVTAAMMCAAVTCVLENRGFAAKDIFMEEVEKILKGGGLGAACTKPAAESPPAPPQKPAVQEQAPDDEDDDEVAEAPAAEPKLKDLQDGFVRIPSVAEFNKLGEYGYRNDETIVRVQLPEGVEHLPGSFFYGCGNLEEVWLPDSLREIGPYAFYGCEKLHAIHMSETSGLREINEYAFAMCSSLQTFAVPAMVETLGTSVFRFCSALTKLSFVKDGKLRSIGSHLLQNCTALEKLRLPDAITTIPTSMFYGCSKLRKVTAKGVDTIEDYAFYGNESLKTIRIRTKKSIAAQAFEGCDPSLEIEYLNY